ncbi:hypothetical protein ACFSYG_15250 [Leeuwenhoekiella polynyae]|uniref:Uncharacterized protein n=1 Tax=Leeuwenhoekiella polynyae TaxID=1550906 RepID=A0A4Q0NZ04_9FLAO|nr:hypothetical protein [Leeuwenhoekiella polynyae]RXG17805.1 hypothetical protein DSM02_3141 [Leeuwenhoekiella polynyae]
MTRILIWVFKLVVSLAVMLPNQEQTAFDKPNVDLVPFEKCKMFTNYSDCNTFKKVENAAACLL